MPDTRPESFISAIYRRSKSDPFAIFCDPFAIVLCHLLFDAEMADNSEFLIQTPDSCVPRVALIETLHWRFFIGEPLLKTLPGTLQTGRTLSKVVIFGECGPAVCTDGRCNRQKICGTFDATSALIRACKLQAMSYKP